MEFFVYWSSHLQFRRFFVTWYFALLLARLLKHLKNVLARSMFASLEFKNGTNSRRMRARLCEGNRFLDISLIALWNRYARRQKSVANGRHFLGFCL